MQKKLYILGLAVTLAISISSCGDSTATKVQKIECDAITKRIEETAPKVGETELTGTGKLERSLDHSRAIDEFAAKCK
jgi:hypothetical protein